jgi:hypothetical protein
LITGKINVTVIEKVHCAESAMAWAYSGSTSGV